MANNNDKKVLNVPDLRFPEFSGEWVETELQDIVPNICSGKDRISNSGEVALYGSTGVIGRTNSASYKENIVLVARVGANAGQMQIGNAPCGVTDNTLVIDAKEWNYYIYYFLQHYNLNRLVFGSGQPLITGGMLKRIKVRYGCKAERNNITRLLCLIDERIATQNKIIEKYESLIQAMCDTLIESEQLKVELSFNDFGKPYSGLSGKSAEDFGNGWPYITYMNVYQNQIIDITDVGLVKINETEQQSVVRYGDILFTLSSETPDEVGMGAVYLGDAYPLYLNSFCFGVHITDESKIFSPFLAYYISTKSFRKAVFPLAQGSTRFNLQKNDFMKKIFHFPTVKKQSEIYSVLKAYSDKLSIEKNIVNLLCEQKSYLLRQLFI